MFQKKFPLPSEKTNTESESSDDGSGRENKSQRKWYQWQKIITNGNKYLEKCPIRGSASLL